jgi:tRNA-dihydrouridine synthase B
VERTGLANRHDPQGQKLFHILIFSSTEISSFPLKNEGKTIARDAYACYHLGAFMLDWTSLPKPIIALAPMADMTDSPFCRIVKSKAPETVIFREMVSSEAIVRDNPKTWNMTAIHPDERPIIQQIFGTDPDVMAKAAEKIFEAMHPDAIDINMGCPMQKIVKTGAGSALMKNPSLAQAIVRAVKSAVPCPVSIKMRLGWKEKTEGADFASRMEEAGVDLITVHGRTRDQMYGGSADWNEIAWIKIALHIPVIANGDIVDVPSALQALATTQADGIALARGALGNPWVFANITRALQRKPLTILSQEEWKQTILTHLQWHAERHGDPAVFTFRKHLSCYLKGLPHAKELRQHLLSLMDLTLLQHEIASL